MKKPLHALVDTGSKYSFIYQSALPLDATTSSIPGMTTRLLDCTTLINQAVELEDIVMPELNASMHVTRPFRAYVAEAQATSFDVILRQDFNINLGINVLNSWRVVSWMGHEVPF